jgi:hypothetical protein
MLYYDDRDYLDYNDVDELYEDDYEFTDDDEDMESFSRSWEFDYHNLTEEIIDE